MAGRIGTVVAGAITGHQPQPEPEGAAGLGRRHRLTDLPQQRRHVTCARLLTARVHGAVGGQGDLRIGTEQPHAARQCAEHAADGHGGEQMQGVTSQTVRTAVRRRARMSATPSWAMTDVIAVVGMVGLRASTVSMRRNVKSTVIARIVHSTTWLLVVDVHVRG